MSTLAVVRPTDVGPFTTYPGKNVIADFMAWVEKTGSPDTWRHHDPNPPQPQPYEELVPFGVPHKLRAQVGMASCPICSPNAPKYFEGVLVWFPREGKLRAIGHDCAAGHFGQMAVNAAVQKRKHREQLTSAEDYLLETLPKIASIRTETQNLQSVARDIDATRHTFWLRTSKADCIMLARLGQSGTLAIETTKSAASVDQYGVDHSRRVANQVAVFQVRGLEFLRRKFLVASLAINTLTALQLCRAATSEEALHLLSDGELSKPDYMFQAERVTRAAIKNFDTLQQAVEEARDFLASSNLMKLTAWSTHPDSLSPIIIRYDPKMPGHVHVRSRAKAGADVPIKPSLRG